jgi:hypothetical protein
MTTGVRRRWSLRSATQICKGLLSRPHNINRCPGQARPPARAAPRPIPARDGQARRAGTEEYLRLKAALMGLLWGDWQKSGAVESATERIVAVWTTNADGPRCD